MRCKMPTGSLAPHAKRGVAFDFGFDFDFAFEVAFEFREPPLAGVDGKPARLAGKEQRSEA